MSFLKPLRGSLWKVKHQAGIHLVKIKEHQVYGRVLKPANANAKIAQLIDSTDPVLIARLGATEMRVVREFEEAFPEYRQETMIAIQRNSGFFPAEKPFLDRFSQHYIDSIKKIDMLGIWYVEKEVSSIKKYCPKAHLCNLEDLEPYYHEKPWSSKLEDKKVLVVHPFARSIQKNYDDKRTLLFKNPSMLPLFHLQTVRSVQSLAGTETSFRNWFEAYDSMCEEISKIDFDVAILGCGAYGLPIGSFIKAELQKTAIHLGGATQILFGIKGKRWDDNSFFRDKMYNEHWVRPSEDEVIRDHKIVEGGAYW
jgi:hypothetical protein